MNSCIWNIDRSCDWVVCCQRHVFCEWSDSSFFVKKSKQLLKHQLLKAKSFL